MPVLPHRPVESLLAQGPEGEVGLCPPLRRRVPRPIATPGPAALSPPAGRGRPAPGRVERGRLWLVLLSLSFLAGVPSRGAHHDRARPFPSPQDQGPCRVSL